MQYSSTSIQGTPVRPRPSAKPSHREERERSARAKKRTGASSLLIVRWDREWKGEGGKENYFFFAIPELSKNHLLFSFPTQLRRSTRQTLTANCRRVLE